MALLHIRVRTALLEAGVSQAAIAAELGITPQAVSAVVRGTRANPRVRQLIAERTGKAYTDLWGKAPRGLTAAADKSTKRGGR